MLLVFLSHVGFDHIVPGGFGVTVFFFLSGFLITTLLIREWDRHGRVSLSAFYLRRIIRLGPPIVITIALSLCLTWAGILEGTINFGTIASQLFFYYNYYTLYVPTSEAMAGLNVLWSLSVEEHFYLIWPALFILTASGRLGLRTLVALLLAIFLWRSFRFLALGDTAAELYISTDTRFDSLLFGCLLAHLVWKDQAKRLFEPFNKAYVLVVLALALLAFTFVFRDPTFRATLRYSLQGLALMPLFYYAVRHPDAWLFRPLNWMVMRKLGLWSYTTYLVHFAVIKGLVYNGVGELGEPVLIVSSALLSVGIAALVYQFAEKPLHPLRRRMTGHGKQG